MNCDHLGHETFIYSPFIQLQCHTLIKILRSFLFHFCTPNAKRQLRFFSVLVTMFGKSSILVYPLMLFCTASNTSVLELKQSFNLKSVHYVHRQSFGNKRNNKTLKLPSFVYFKIAAYLWKLVLEKLSIGLWLLFCWLLCLCCLLWHAPSGIRHWDMSSLRPEFKTQTSKYLGVLNWICVVIKWPPEVAVAALL